ncbi:MAG: efflux RND transporter periplasmic adaptor subunit, partial [Verrucomicrobiae bacterium]|nr:efflux RND transporter periplasmic adaptor subunit [Verrucomicrobiae bacterium]
MKTIPLLCLLWFSAGLAVSAETTIIGTTEPQKKTELSFPEYGVIREILVKEGESVKKDQVLARLDCRVLESQLQIAKMKAESTAAIQSARATLEMRSHRYEELQKLALSQKTNDDEVARAKADFEIAQADLQLANEAAQEHALEALQIDAQIEQRTLRSPFDGMVARIVPSVGTTVTPQSAALVTVVKLDHLDLVAHVDHRRIDALKEGQEVTVEAVDRPVTGTGTIEFISPVV